MTPGIWPTALLWALIISFWGGPLATTEEISFERQFVDLLHDTQTIPREGITPMGKLPHQPPPELLKMLKSEDIKQTLEELSFGPEGNPKFQSDLKKNIFPDASIKWGRIENWKSGGNILRRFKDPEISFYFESIFKYLIDQSRERGQIVRVNRSDLFHGHIIYDQHGQDLIIIFHSKEYPIDLEPVKAQASFTYKNEPIFHSFEMDFKKRNFIFSVKNNFLWNVGTASGDSARPLIFPEDFSQWENESEIRFSFEAANSIHDSRFETLGFSIGDINYFPEEDVPPFMASFN